MFDYIVIGLVLDEVLTGEAIKKEIESGISFFYKASYGSIYLALKKVVDKGYLSMTEQLHGDRVKKYYRATALGRATFFDWLSSPPDFKFRPGALLAKIYFFDQLPAEVRTQQLQAYEQHNRQILQKLRLIEKQLSDADKANYFMLSTLYYGINTLQYNIRWFRHIEAQKPLSEFTWQEDEIGGLTE